MNEQQNASSSSGNDGPNRQPVFLLPQSVMIFIMVLLVIHAAYEFSLDADGKLQVWIWLGFISARFFDPTIPGGMLPLLWTPVTHAFLHGDWTHVLMNVAWLAIFGTPVARRYGGIIFVFVFFVGVLGGVALYAVLQWDTVAVLIGASGGVAGLTGAAMRFVFQPVEIARDPVTGKAHVLGRRLASMSELWNNSRARMFTLFWLGLNLAIPVYSLFTGTNGPMIAWQAHIGGFAAGLMLPGFIERWKVNN